MTRLRSFSRLAGLASLVTAASLGCGETTSNPPSQLNLDRPTDVAFACYGGMRITNGGPADPAQEITVSAMPTHSCEVRSEPFNPNATPPEEQHTPPGQEKLPLPAPLLGAVNWYGFVLQSGPGTVAVVNFPTKPVTSLSDIDLRVDDADELTPGKNGISVGEDPVAIVTDRAGCHAITANAGSCDLSVLDVTSALDTDPAIKVDRLAVKNASGVAIRSRPAAMVAEPSTADVGNVCPATPTGLVYIAYPSCHLVAGVDAATGTIVTGIQYAGGVPTIVGGDVTCPDECAGELPAPGIRPVAIDMELDPRTATRRLVIGSENSPSIAIVELDDASRPLSVSQLALENTTGDLGVTAIALSPEIGMGGNSEVINDDGPGGQFQFVYAIATDHSVRVADILNVRQECDTQVDPRLVRDIRMVRRLSCFPVGDPTTPARRPGAGGPGIRVPGVPFSVDFIRAEKPCTSGAMQCDRDPKRLVGYFAMVSTSLGATFVVNVDDDNHPDVFNDAIPVDVPMGLVLPHRLRDAIGQRGARIAGMDAEDDPSCDSSGPSPDAENLPQGGPRAIGTPARSVPAGSVAIEKITQLPGFRQLACFRKNMEGNTTEAKAITELSFAAPDAVRDVVFSDLDALTPEETWSFTWEGSLSNNRGETDVGGPAVRESMMFVDGAGIHLRDQQKPFCEAGVEPFDIVELQGCDPSVGTADCPSGYTCFIHPDSQVPGLGACMRADEADRLANACRDFLTTIRRYTVKTAASGELQLLPRRHELRTTPLDGCTDDAQCEALADYAARSGKSTHPVNDNTPADPHTWACVADPDRAPMGGTGKRCEMKCNVTADCQTGTICAGAVAGQNMSGFCMEGVTPPQSCVNAPQRYELHAGEAFAVLGTRSGFVHPIVADAAGQCVKHPLAGPLVTGRLPLEPKDRLAPNTLHACDPMANPLTGMLPNGTYEPNPCSTTVAHTDAKVRYVPGTCTLDSPASELVERQAPAVRFRNRGMTLTIVDPSYPGDAMCITDRGGNLGKIPHVVPGYVLSFRQTAGFAPRTLPSRATFPTRVLRGPLNTTWVVDQGDFLSSSSTAASTRGSVFVYDGLRVINVLQ